jgi:hypothetical protein
MFSRPFVQNESTAAASPNSATLILLDRSASMRRADLWKQAIAEAEKQLKAAKLTDRISLAVFDRELTPLWSFEEDRNTPANRLTAIQTRLAALTPTWKATHLDRALIAAVPSFDSSTTSLKKRIHLISDLQEGTKLDALRTIAWPAELTLSVHRLDPATNDNLSIALAAREDDRSADALVRIRLSNTRDSALRDFTLAWQDAPKTDAITAQIPPGASRILTAPPNSTNATTLTLTGDTHDFDNRIFIAPPQPRTVRIHFLGKDATRDEASAPLYYLARALQPTATLAPVLTADEKLPAQPADILFIVGSAPADGLRDYIERGGFLVTVPSDATLLKTLTGLDLTVTADTSDEYRMLAEVKTEHPLLKPFADPKLRDFTKLRFWKHRHIESKRLNPRSKPSPPSTTAIPPSSALASAKARSSSSPRAGIRRQPVRAQHEIRPAPLRLARRRRFQPRSRRHAARRRFVAARCHAGSHHHRSRKQNAQPQTRRNLHHEQIGLHKVQSAGATPKPSPSISRPTKAASCLWNRKNSPNTASSSPPLLTTSAASETTDQRLTATDTEQRQNLWWWFLVTLLAVLLLETAVAGRSRHVAAPA